MGVYTSGQPGYFAYKSNETGGVLRYLPTVSFDPYIQRGDRTIPLVNNVPFTANDADGITVGQFTLQAPLMPLVMPADFYARAFGSTSGDDETKNYHTFTRQIDGTATAPDVFARAKFATESGQVTFSPDGAQSAWGLTFTGMIFDPLSGSVAALTAPSAGALTTGKVMGYAKTTFTGASNIVQIRYVVNTGLQIAPGVLAGTNANYPNLALGGFMSGISGGVTITQARKAATVIGADGTPGTLVLSIGATGYGLTKTFRLKPIGTRMRSSLGPNYIDSTYELRSIDGTTSPYVVADL